MGFSDVYRLQCQITIKDSKIERLEKRLVEAEKALNDIVDYTGSIPMASHEMKLAAIEYFANKEKDERRKSRINKNLTAK